MQAPIWSQTAPGRSAIVGNFPARTLDSPTAGLLPLHRCHQSSLQDWLDAALHLPSRLTASARLTIYIPLFASTVPLPPSACSYPPITAIAVFYNHPVSCHPSLGEGKGVGFPFTNHPNSPFTPPLGRGWGWVFPAPASLQRLRKKFTGPSVNFLQGPWSNLTAALENYYKAPGALLQGCWRNLTDTPGKPATAAIMHKKVHLRSAERKKRRLFYCIAHAF